MNYEWTKLYFQTQFEAFAKRLGKECGLREKEEHERMKAYVDEQTALLRNLVEIQRKTIESQNERLRSVEGMFARPEAPIVDVTGRRLS